MAVLTRCLVATACTALALLGVWVSAVEAQGLRPPVIPPRGPLPTNRPFTIPTPFNPNPTMFINPNFRLTPNLTLGQAAFNTSVMGQAFANVPPYALGYNPYPQVLSTGPAVISPYGANPYTASLATGAYNPYSANPYTATLSTNPYAGGYGSMDAGATPYSGYYPSYDPYSGYLRGAADITNANGRFLSQVQQARILQTQADLGRLDFMRKAREEADYERRRAYPDAEGVRRKSQQTALDRARHEPPFSEILSGQALNDLFTQVAAEQAKGIKGPKVDLDETLLKNVNLKGASVPGNVGLLKDDGKLTWPASLRGPEFDQPRKSLSELIPPAVRQIRYNKAVPAGTIKDMRAEMDRLNDILNRNVPDLPPSQYIEARRYLNGLNDAIKALDDPNAVNYFNGNWSAQAHNVAELVELMRTKGLQFAPAAAGDEPAYSMLYRALAAFDAGMSQATASK